jgi:hypothetical protein
MPFFLLMLAVNRGKNCYCHSFSGDYCYCKSKAIDEIMALVLQIMPELQELCGERSPSMSMLHLQEDPLGTSTVASFLMDIHKPRARGLRGECKCKEEEEEAAAAAEKTGKQ